MLKFYYKVGPVLWQSEAALIYYKVGQVLLQSAPAFLHKKVWKRYYKSGAGIGKWGKYCKAGNLLLQSRVVITEWDNYWNVGQHKF